MAIKLPKQDTGSTVYQVTEDSLPKSNIYCETPYCSADSRYFVFARTNPQYEINRTEYVVCELGTWKMKVGGRGIGGPAISRDGVFYFMRDTNTDARELVKLNLSTGKSDVGHAASLPEVVHTFSEKVRLRSLGTVSPDRTFRKISIKRSSANGVRAGTPPHRYKKDVASSSEAKSKSGLSEGKGRHGRFYAFGVTLDAKFSEFGIELVDLETGASEIIDRDPYILNPHPQFEPSEGKQLMIQHNRGGKIDENGKRIRLVGEEGATLYLLDIADGRRTPLQVGKPHTTPATGHEAWIGDTHEVLLTVSAEGDFAPEKGNLLAVAAGKPARVVSRGYRFSHVGTSRCGRFFSCDDASTGDVVIGSISTGKNAVVCHSESSFGRAQNTHPHPYLTPDLKWVIFNSDRSGKPQVHAATVPEGILQLQIAD